MNRIIALLPLVVLSSCTTTRVDDHSYHYSSTQPSNTSYVYHTNTEEHQVLPRPSIQQQDQEYIQYQQGPQGGVSYQPQSYVPIPYVNPVRYHIAYHMNPYRYGSRYYRH